MRGRACKRAAPISARQRLQHRHRLPRAGCLQPIPVRRMLVDPVQRHGSGLARIAAARQDLRHLCGAKRGSHPSPGHCGPPRSGPGSRLATLARSFEKWNNGASALSHIETVAARQSRDSAVVCGRRSALFRVFRCHPNKPAPGKTICWERSPRRNGRVLRPISRRSTCGWATSSTNRVPISPTSIFQPTPSYRCCM